ncbi:ATP-grasp domain-containing protein [Desulfurivibrio alkaliphilus]|uniref:RimK domain protein ATP-grasp n=1 Tax=Desulfurivibrio alkaliphilus (strain DSM 19089 / UNIQEM U267 / AHT2) TaxID=589865 RepID=D6Z6E5_DESAT|nr:glutathione synthase [Desulfurivibrio alkaliphilus]ADH86910.1 RimK domain protein ATP-grasp [Desulfurivibrio alkaliphilus AHT 2]
MSGGGEVISFHPEFEGERFIWDRCVWDSGLPELLRRSRAVILPQTVARELYFLCRRCAPAVFPNYDCRFRWEGKTGDTLLFWQHGAPHPGTLIFPRVESMVGEHPEMGLNVELPPFPLVLKARYGGEGGGTWLVEDDARLRQLLSGLERREWQGERGFVVQEYIPGTGRDLRVTVIGEQLFSYWRVNPNAFHHNLARNGVVDRDADPDLQRRGRALVRDFCRQTGINLAGFDLIFPPDGREPMFLEINYTFGRSGLGGGEGYRALLRAAVEEWLETT